MRLTRDLLSRTPSVKGEILKQIRFKRKYFFQSEQYILVRFSNIFVMTLVRLTGDLPSRSASVKGEILKQIRFKRKYFFQSEQYILVRFSNIFVMTLVRLTGDLPSRSASVKVDVRGRSSCRSWGRRGNLAAVRCKYKYKNRNRTNTNTKSVVNLRPYYQPSRSELQMLYIRIFIFFQKSNTC